MNEKFILSDKSKHNNLYFTIKLKTDNKKKNERIIFTGNVRII